MLEIELIKKGCELADGFRYHESPDKYTKFDQLVSNVDYHYFDSATFKDLAYPLFLQRVIEGINKKSRKETQTFTIMMNHAFLDVYNWNNMKKDLTIYFQDTTPDQAKEQAIIYILKNI
jgi:hypothetical protein